jgi:hypothetical protein
MTLGNPRISQSECFDEVRFQLSTIDSAVDYRTGDNKLNSLKNTYAERSRCYQKIIDDSNLEVDQQGMLNLTANNDKLQKFRSEWERLRVETADLKRESAICRFKAIKSLIRSGNKYRKARELFMRIKKEIKGDPYQEVLKRSYACEAKFIPNVMTFAQMFNQKSLYEIIADEIKRCNQTESVYLLSIDKLLGNGKLREEVYKIYENFVGHIKQKSYEKLKTTMQYLPGAIDFSKLFRMALEELTLRDSLDFIDNLHAYSQNIVVQLYDQLMEQGFKNKNEHLEIAKWMKDKLNWIRMQPSQSAITGDLQPYLEQLVERLPHGIRIFAFEPSVIISTENHGYLMRTDSHTGVRFKVIPDESGKFFRFEDERYNKGFFCGDFKDVKSDDNRKRVRVGADVINAYYWEIVLSEEGEFFHLKNKETGLFLSSEEDKVCKEKNWLRRCKHHEWMNRAVADSSSASTKWMFTDKLIRNEILPDRFS